MADFYFLAVIIALMFAGLLESGVFHLGKLGYQSFCPFLFAGESIIKILDIDNVVILSIMAINS